MPGYEERSVEIIITGNEVIDAVRTIVLVPVAIDPFASLPIPENTPIPFPTMPPN
jgi:hypothetical protein